MNVQNKLEITEKAGIHIACTIIGKTPLREDLPNKTGLPPMVLEDKPLEDKFAELDRLIDYIRFVHRPKAGDTGGFRW